MIWLRPLITIGMHFAFATLLNFLLQKLLGWTGIEAIATYFVVLATRYLMMIHGFSLAYLLQPEQVEANLRNWRNSLIKEDKQ